MGAGKRGEPEVADYVLMYRNHKLAVIEAKAWEKPYTEGLAQAKAYAQKLAVRFTYSTNGQKIYGVDMLTGQEGDVAQYPSPIATSSPTKPIMPSPLSPEDALVRIEPYDIRKKGKVPKNGSLFFTIFQTFMSGPPKDGKPSLDIQWFIKRVNLITSVIVDSGVLT